MFDGKQVEVVDEYTYLGVVFTYNNKFKRTQKEQIAKARRAMYSLIVKSKKLRLPVDIQLELFDHLVMPILLYGCEIWGFENVKQIETLHMQFCKQLLRFKKSTPNCMVLGELGRVEMLVFIKERMINFWFKSITGKENKLSSIMCNVLRCLDVYGVYTSPWVKFIKNSINELGMTNVWLDYQNVNKSWLRLAVKQRLNDMFHQNWHSTINESSQCVNYRLFKTTLRLEEYMVKLPIQYRVTLTKFRCGNHRLPIVTGRYLGIDRKDRICKKCLGNKLGDEFHYIFECSFFESERKKFLKTHYRERPNVLKMYQLFNSVNDAELINLVKFCKLIILHIC